MDFRGNWLSIKLFLVGGLERFLFFHNIWDNPSHWLFFFRGVETTNRFMFDHSIYFGCEWYLITFMINYDGWTSAWWFYPKKTYVFVPYVLQSSKRMLANSTRCGFIVTFVWFNIHKRILYMNHVFQSYRIDLNSAWKPTLFFYCC